ncbi:MAG: amidohydrolase family protein [Phycisphaerales bacterium]|nr:amidohydrolase family protein [Phycisphaerales bacterium]
MNFFRTLSLAAAFAASSFSFAQDAKPADRYSVIRCGTLLDIAGTPAKKNATLVVKNGVVDRVVEGLGPIDLAKEQASGANVQEIDLRDKFVLPGLIDCHVHLTFEFNKESRLRSITESECDSAIRGVLAAKKTVEAGFTTVRDLGGESHAVFALRHGVVRGDIVGPRIVAAGKAISVSGGHADPSNGWRDDVYPQPGPEAGVADGPDECRKAVRLQIKNGADVIKITATGGVLSLSSAGLAKHFTDDEIQALVDTTHSMGRKIAAHAHGTDGINAVLRAGIDSVEHGTYMDEESIRLFKAGKTWLVPTLLASATVVKNAKIPGFYHEFVARKALEAGPVRMQRFKIAVKEGVRVAFGTDSGVSPHGENWMEFPLMVEGGMTPSECLVAATINAASLLGLEKEIGTLEPGKSADLIAVDGDPTADVNTLKDVKFVMRAGGVVKK